MPRPRRSAAESRGIQRPFVLSEVEGLPFLLRKKGEGQCFDKLSTNGSLDRSAYSSTLRCRSRRAGAARDTHRRCGVGRLAGKPDLESPRRPSFGSLSRFPVNLNAEILIDRGNDGLGKRNVHGAGRVGGEPDVDRNGLGCGRENCECECKVHSCLRSGKQEIGTETLTGQNNFETSGSFRGLARIWRGSSLGERFEATL